MVRLTKMQGVAITIFVKTGKKKTNKLGKVFHYDLFGKRDDKYDFLLSNEFKSIKFKKLKPNKPNLFFVPKDEKGREQYETGIKLSRLFIENGVGFITANDKLNISFSEKEHRKKIEEILTMQEFEWRTKYNRPKDAQSWKYNWAKEDALENIEKNISKVSYRIFDLRYTLYTGKSGGLYARPTFQVMQNYYERNNIGLLTTKSFRDASFAHVFCTKNISEAINLSPKTASNAMNFPLYIYPVTNGQQSLQQGATERTPNLNQEIVAEISEKLGLTYTNEKVDTKNTFAPINILDYIYAVLHSPSYREKYKEFLKIDFPRVPYPKDKKTFWSLVKLGKEVREIHLLESNKVEDYITSYEMAENAENDHNVITTKIGKKDWVIIDTEKQLGRIWINESKYFDNIPQTAWEFYIGGYQPAQKWLKDRKERELKFEDILHYQKIIVALTETDRIMKEIDKIEIE
jgi:predicted helicase